MRTILEHAPQEAHPEAFRAAYHEPFTQPNALNLYAFILYEDDIETTSPQEANPKAFNAA